MWMSMVGLLFPLLVWAQTTSTTSSVGKAIGDPSNLDTPSEAFWVVEMMIKAFKSGHWALFAALILTALVACLRFFEVGKKIPKEYVPWFTGGMASATSVALGLYIGLDWWAIATTGLSVGLMAIGGWETIGKLLKKLLNKIKGGDDKKEDPPEKPAEAEGGS
jgi:hypothetical protein